MEATNEFQFGDWQVSPDANLVSNGDVRTQLEPRVMSVLRYLCRHPGAVIPAEEILQACWGSNELGDNPVHKAITQLRRALGDSSTEPRYIETIRKRGYRAIATVIRQESAAPATWSGGSPFRGLEAFQENHAGIFFGRVQATAQLRTVALAQASQECAMVLVLGPSGSGKTSLVRAGLLPQLMATATRPEESITLSSTVYLDCADLGSGTLFQALAGSLIDADLDNKPLFPGASADSLGQRLADDAAGVAAELRERGCAKPCVGVFVDRLEAVFRAEVAEANRFLTALDLLARSHCLFVITACRNDFYPEVMSQPLLMELKARGGHFDVMPPDGADIAQIVRQPARAANLTFEQDPASGANLDDVLCDAARGSPDTLPLLQYCLNELYRQRTDDGTLRFDIYRQLGGIEGAVGIRAEQVVAGLTPAQNDALPRVLSLLVNIGDDQTTVTSRRSPLASLRSDNEKELVRVMVEARLFVSELAGDIPSFGVAHEALLRQWPRVLTWIERYRNALQLRTRIGQQSQRWHGQGRPPDLLIPRGSQIIQAAELLELKDFTLDPSEILFIRESIRRSRRGERIRLAAIVSIVLLGIASSLLGLAAHKAQRSAERSKYEAEDLMTFMLGDFVDKLRPLGRLELLDDVTAKASQYLAKLDDSNDPASLLQRAKTLNIIAQVHVAKGKERDAIEGLENSRKALLTLQKSTAEDRVLLRELGINSFMLGKVYFNQGKWSRAQEFMLEYLAYSERFAGGNEQDVGGWMEKSYAHNSLGSVALKRKDYASAVTHLSKSLELKRRSLAKHPDDKKLVGDIANSLSWLGEASIQQGTPQLALAQFKEEEALLRPAARENAVSMQRLALSLYRQAPLYLAFGEKEKSSQAIKEAETLFVELTAKDPSNRLWLSRLYMAQMRKHEFGSKEKASSASVESLRGLLANFRALLKEDAKIPFATLMPGRVYYLLALQHLAQKQYVDAEHTLQQSIAEFENLSGDKASDPIFAAYLADTMYLQAELAERRSYGSGKSLCQRALSTLEALSKDSKDYLIMQRKVRFATCADALPAALTQHQALLSMGYKDAAYLQYVSTHLSKKGTQ